MSELFLFLIVWLGFAAACGVVAKAKNKSVLIWFVRGLAFGAISLTYLLLTPSE